MGNTKSQPRINIFKITLIAILIFALIFIYYFVSVRRVDSPVSTPPTPNQLPQQSSFKVVDNEVINRFKVYSRGLEAKGGTVIKGDEEWQLYLSQLADNVPLDVPKVVDFSKEDLIVVSAGLKATGGYSVKVKRVEVRDDALVVTVMETQPGEECFVTEAFTTPSDFVVIKKTNLPVEFNFAVQVQDCSS